MSDFIRIYASTNKYRLDASACVSFQRNGIVGIEVSFPGKMNDAYRVAHSIPAAVTRIAEVTIYFPTRLFSMCVDVYDGYIFSFLDYIEGNENAFLDDLEIFSGENLK